MQTHTTKDTKGIFTDEKLDLRRSLKLENLIERVWFGRRLVHDLQRLRRSSARRGHGGPGADTPTPRSLFDVVFRSVSPFRL